MKRIIMLTMLLVMMLVSIQGCWIVWDRDGSGGADDRDGGYDRDQRHEQRR